MAERSKRKLEVTVKIDMTTSIGAELEEGYANCLRMHGGYGRTVPGIKLVATTVDMLASAWRSQNASFEELAKLHEQFGFGPFGQPLPSSKHLTPEDEKQLKQAESIYTGDYSFFEFLQQGYLCSLAKNLWPKWCRVERYENPVLEQGDWCEIAYCKAFTTRRRKMTYCDRVEMIVAEGGVTGFFPQGRYVHSHKLDLARLDPTRQQWYQTQFVIFKFPQEVTAVRIRKIPYPSDV
jgi:hypothetical protein